LCPAKCSPSSTVLIKSNSHTFVYLPWRRCPLSACLSKHVWPSLPHCHHILPSNTPRSTS
jgi:hypothetical protein